MCYVESKEYPKHFWNVGMSVAATWTFQKWLIMIVVICLEQVSLSYLVENLLVLVFTYV